MARIDNVSLTLWVYDEFAGHRTVTITIVPADDPAFAAECERVWREYSERIAIEARERGGDWGMIG